MYERVINEATTEKMKNTKWAQTICAYLTRLNEYEYPPSYIDVIFQKWGGQGPPNIYDAYCFAQIHYMIRTGELGVFQVPVGAIPVRDSRVKRQNTLLAKLPYPFKAEFWGGTQDEDGYLEWKKPVNCIINDGQDSLGFVIARPQAVELEVGYQPAYKTFFQLHPTHQGLARWPYGHENITVLLHRRNASALDAEDFSELRKEVVGDFNYLPNPYEEWNKWKPKRA